MGADPGELFYAASVIVADRARPRAGGRGRLFSALVLTAALAPGEASAGPARATLQVDAAETAGAADSIETRILDRGGAMLRRSEVLAAQSRDDGLILVTVRPLGRRKPGYRYQIVCEANGEVLPSASVSGSCPGCLPTELVDRVSTELERVIPVLRDALQTAEEASPAEQPAEPVAEGKPGRDDAAVATRPELRPLGIAGIAVLSTGVAAAVTGAVLWSRGEVVTTEPGEIDQRGRNYVPPGIAMVTVGVVAAITGATLIAIERTRARRSEPRVTVAPRLLGDIGLHVGGRF